MDLAKFIDHTELHPAAPRTAIVARCDEARAHQFFAVCVAAERVALAARQLSGSAVRVVAVVGFPHGHGHPETLAAEAARAVEEGAREIDMVAPLGDIADGDYAGVSRTVTAVRRVVADAVLKVILETGHFSRQQVEQTSLAAISAGADFLKTSTGYGPRGADLAEVAWLVQLAAGRAEVKAAGGIRDAATAAQFITAGATRLGCSASLAIIGRPGFDAGY